MGWQYFVICLFDFMILPIIYMALQGPGATAQWEPLTLRGGGVYHMAMGAIVGLYTWGKSQERMTMMRDPQFGSYVVGHELRSEANFYDPTGGIDPDLSTPLEEHRKWF
jgi:hypothetical protein